MKFENFLNKWYEIRKEGCVKNENYLRIGIDNLFPGNLNKILTKIRIVGSYMKSKTNINKMFYSYKKEIYLNSSFVYFEFISYIVNRINTETDLFCTGTSCVGSKEDYKDIRDYFIISREQKKSNSIGFSLGQFWGNGSCELRIFTKDKKEIKREDSLYIDQIVNDGIQLLLEKVEKIIRGEEPIYTESFFVKDKESGLIDLRINLNFYTDKIISNVFNPEGYDIGDYESINQEIEKYNLGYYIKSIEENNYDSTRCVDEIKEVFMENIRKHIINSNLFNIDSEKKDFKIKTFFKDDLYKRNNKYLLNNGNISKEDFFKIKNDLKDDECFSSILLEAIN